jgi:hypothetical protein
MGVKESLDIEFERVYHLYEGVHDKGIFKAVFLVGGPGSGKDYVLKKTLDGHGLTEINSDKALEHLGGKEGSDKKDKVRSKAKDVTEVKQKLAFDGRNGIIINGTGDDYEKIADIKKRLDALGYESSMIMVNTADDVSANRNVERGQKGGRAVPENVRKQKWQAVQESRPKLAKLFGDNYIDYLKKIDWKQICTEKVSPKVFYVCKNNTEKDFIVTTLNNWDDVNLLFDGQLKSIYEMFATKAFIEEHGIDLKFKSKNTYEFHNLLEKWKLIKKHIKTGFKVRYNLPDEVIQELEQPIIHEDKTYIPKLVLSEDQFRIEGMLMKNCMGGQFNLGAYYLYVAISCGSKRVNVQYRKGTLAQARGKTNIDLPKQFDGPVKIFTERMVKYKDLTWKKEKYDFITN